MEFLRAGGMEMERGKEGNEMDGLKHSVLHAKPLARASIDGAFTGADSAAEGTRFFALRRPWGGE